MGEACRFVHGRFVICVSPWRLQPTYEHKFGHYLAAIVTSCDVHTHCCAMYRLVRPWHLVNASAPLFGLPPFCTACIWSCPPRWWEGSHL